MKIAFLWTHGGPATWNDTYLETGIGGSESMMIQYAREFGRQGHHVVCLSPGDHDPLVINNAVWFGIDPKDWNTWPPLEGFDALISVRMPLPLEYGLINNIPIRALLANDQTCQSLPLAVESDFCNLIITISKHQMVSYQMKYADIPHYMYLQSSAGVKVSDFYHEGKRDWDHCIYASTPERGLWAFSGIWPKIIRDRKNAHLTITSGFQLYGMDEETCNRLSKSIYDAMRRLPHVYCQGRPYARAEYIGLMKNSGLMLYPSNYDEQCCIAALEAAAAGVPIITTARAALNERVIDGVTGYLVPGEPGTPEYDEMFASLAISLLYDEQRAMEMGRAGRELARQFDYSVLVEQWTERFKA